MAQETVIVNGNHIFTALNSITEEAKNDKKKRGLDFRFLDKDDSKTSVEKKNIFDKVEEIEKELEEKFGISVEFYENIDIKNTSEGHKFYFRIYDENNCFTEIDALDYRKIVLDPSKSEIDYIVEKLFVVVGLKVQADVLKISELITELISYVYYFDELQFKLYENIGWDIYNKELIFKYDKIYKKDAEEIRSACISDIAGKLTSESTEENEAIWRDKFGKLMNSSTVARIVISAACTGLVRSVMPYNKENNINMNIVGEPGSGKSSLSQFALSIFGDPHALEGSFIDKDNAMEIIRVKRPVIPYILDDRLLKIDTLSDKAKGRELLFDVFREYEGKVTERVGGAYKELSGKRTNAPIISSSVESMMDVLLSSGKDLGQYRRFIEVELKSEDIFDNSARVVEEYHNLAYQSYGVGVKYIANYIMNNGIEFVNDLYDCVLNDITDKLEKKTDEVGVKGLTSSASRFALIATTYIIIREAINQVNSEDKMYSVAYNIEDIGYNYEFENMMDSFNCSNGLEKYDALSKLETLLQDGSEKTIRDYIAPNTDAGYDELVGYLIDNLVKKMNIVSFDVDMFKNLKDFLKKESNMKWFIKTNKTDFFKNQTHKYIGMIEEVGNTTKITFKGKKYIEWFLCSGKELSDEQVQDYLEVINQKSDPRSFAEKLFGKGIINKDIEEEISKYDQLSYCKEKNTNSERNPVSITITLPEVEGQKDETE